jgi:hypothetical protein
VKFFKAELSIRFSMIFVCLVHDESTFKSGEVSAKRWFFGDQAPFHSKGRGKSNMVSDFLMQHPAGPFFQLDENEYKRAVDKYPELQAPSDIEYIQRTATASIQVGRDAYFDNPTILEQFERIFKMLKYKVELKAHAIEFIVDNARTHSAKSHSVYDFGKSIGTRCPVDTIEFVDSQGTKQTLDCYFISGPEQGLSKGLLEIATELKLTTASNLKLNELQKLLSDHPAFSNVS